MPESRDSARTPAKDRRDAFAPGYPIQVATIALGSGRRRVELPSGVAISGIVMVKDQGPGPNVPLFANPTVAPNLLLPRCTRGPECRHGLAR